MKKEDFKKEFSAYAQKDMGIGSLTMHEYYKRFSNMTRAVIEERPTNFREIDVFSRLMMDRIIFLGLQVDDNISNIIVAQLLFLQSVDPKRDIFMYINSPGGSVTAGMAMYDTMQYVNPDISTVCTGMAASMGAVLLAGGTSGKRKALKHSRIMIHQPSGGMQGQSSDMEISFNLIMSMREELYAILSEHTGQTVKKIEKDADRDFWMKSEEALNYGIVDEVLTKISK